MFLKLVSFVSRFQDWVVFSLFMLRSSQFWDSPSGHPNWEDLKMKSEKAFSGLKSLNRHLPAWKIPLKFFDIMSTLPRFLDLGVPRGRYVNNRLSEKWPNLQTVRPCPIINIPWGVPFSISDIYTLNFFPMDMHCF